MDDIDFCMLDGRDEVITITTIDDLPPEILSAIFVLIPSKRRRPRQLPLEVSLSHVSARWRIVALETPALWTKIDIYSLQSLTWAQAYLERSGTDLPLDVRIDICSTEKRLPSGWQGPLERKRNIIQLLDAIARTLVPHVPRFRTLLVFTFHNTTAATLVSKFDGLIAPNIQRLRVNYAQVEDRMQGSPLSSSSKIMGGGMPLLTFLETDLADSLPSLPYQNLTTLHLHSLVPTLAFKYRSFVDMLTTPKSLVYLSIQGAIDLRDWPLHVNGADFRMGTLKYLRLLDDGLMAVKFLLSLSAPALESLWLDASFDNFHFYFDAAQTINTVKFPALQYLTIPQYGFYDTERFSKAFSTVTTLHLPYASFFHSKRLKEALAGHWSTVKTLVVSMTREAHLPKLVDALTTCRCERILVDQDLLRILRKDHRDDSIGRRVRGMQRYDEPWWLLSQQTCYDEA